MIENLTVVIPWLRDKKTMSWLEQAVRSLPDGIPLVICPNDSKAEMCEQLNQAFQDVETDYVFIMGADDALDEDCLQFLCEAIGTADVAYPSLADYDIYSQNRIRRTRLDDEHWPAVRDAAAEAGIDLDEIAPGDEQVQELVLPAEPPSLWNLQDVNYLPGAFLATTEILRRIPQPDLLVEDWAWHFKAMASGARYVPVRDALYLYRARHDSLTNRIEKTLTEEFGGSAWPIRATIREFVYGDLFPDSDPTSRVPLAATFQVSASETQSYVRALLPARYLPGSVRNTTFDRGNLDQTPTTILLHPGVRAEEHMLPVLREQGKRVLVDVDDDYLSPSLVAWLRKTNAPKIADVWAANQPAHRRVVEAADGVICATAVLAEKYAKHNQNVIVIPNTVDARDWELPMRIEDGIIRIGWAAAAQHTPDAYLVEPALRWASEQPGVRVCLIGMDPGFDFDYTHYGFTRSVQHYRDLISILDIGLAPLHRSRMNDGKSDLKWLDYTMGGALTIASDEAAYASIRDGDDGLVARTPKQFLDALKSALDDPEGTMRMITQARERVLTERAAWRYRDIYLAACGVEPYEIRPIAPAEAVAA